MRRLLFLFFAFFLFACDASQTAEVVVPIQDTKALFTFAPKDTELAVVVRDLDLVHRNGAALMRFLSAVPAVKQAVKDIEDWGDEKLSKSPLDETFLSSLKLAPENGAALFFTTREGQQRVLGVFAIRELEPFLATLRQTGRKLFGDDLTVEKRSGQAEGAPALYDLKPGIGAKLPALVFAHRDGFILISDQEAMVKEAALSKSAVVWEQLWERSPLVKESHDLLLYVSLDGALGQRLRSESPTLFKGFSDSWKALTFTARIEGNVLRMGSFLTTNDAKAMRPFFTRNNGRGDLLSVASGDTVSAARFTLNPTRLWQRYSELPVSSEKSSLRLAELFQASTGLRLSDKEDGILDNLTGDVAYLSGPGLIDFALLFGINKPEPFEKLLSAFWSYAQAGVATVRTELIEQGIDLSFGDPKEEGGHKSYRVVIKHKSIPIPLVIEAGVNSDSMVIAAGPNWIERASSRAGKGASPFYRRLYHPETRQLFEQDPQALAYFQFLDPFEGLESTPGEMSQTIAAYVKDPQLGQVIEVGRLIIAHLYDAAFALFVRDNGFELRARITMM